MDPADIQRKFLKRVGTAMPFGELFDFLPDMYFFVKDRDGVFVSGNRPLMGLLGAERDADYIGKTDLDFFSGAVAAQYRHEDLEVIRNDAPEVDKVWPVPGRDGLLDWYVCTKIPVRSTRGLVMGIAGVMRDSRRAGPVLQPYVAMTEVVGYMMRHYREPIEVGRLAALARLSVSGLERKFRRVFGVTPRKYLTLLRVRAACRDLRHTGKKVLAVGLDHGFCDHSHFTREFTRVVGLPPGRYRERAQAALRSGAGRKR
jgi:AraC-like DNA-binding protein